MNLSVTEKRILRAGAFRLPIALGIILTFTIFIHGNAGAETAVDIVAPEGCSMAHCDQGLSDNTQLLAPLSGGVVTFWRDTAVNGSMVGLGCVANIDTVVCSFRPAFFGGSPVEIRAYNADGNPLWSSTALGRQAFLSAPMIGPDGGVIAVDNSNLIRFSPSGAVVWNRSTAGGTPLSPNVTDNGKIVLATWLVSQVSAYDFTTGDLIAQLSLDGFDTLNTAAIRGNRIYIAATSGSSGRLYALDLVQDTGDYSFEIAWYFEYEGPTGTSPTLGWDGEDRTVIYFDGEGCADCPGGPQAIAVTDMGSSGDHLWSYPLPTGPQASPTLDPRGGIWYFAFGSSELLRLNESSGELMQTINVNSIVDDDTGTFDPASVMTISGDAGSPVGIVAASSSSKTYIIAINLETESLLWKFQIATAWSGGTSGQFAMLINDSGNPVVVFSTRQNGVWGLVLGCVGDYEQDGDVDGIDLLHLIAGELINVTVEDFADCFGRSDCPIPAL